MTVPKSPRLPSFADLAPSAHADLTALPLDGRVEDAAFVDDVAAGADLEDTVFTGCSFRRVGLSDADLNRASFGDCRFTELNAPVFRAPDSSWFNTRLAQTRLGSAELYGASLRSVRFDGGKLGYANLRQAKLRDVAFHDVVFDELDLGSATLDRVSFTDCRIDTLTLDGAKLKDVDLRGVRFRAISGLAGLRGATIDAFQLADLAPALAAHVGLVVAD